MLICRKKTNYDAEVYIGVCKQLREFLEEHIQIAGMFLLYVLACRDKMDYGAEVYIEVYKRLRHKIQDYFCMAIDEEIKRLEGSK